VTSRLAHTLFAAAIAASALVTAGPAFAQSEPSATVRFDDLNLTDARDVSRLDARVHRAADQICGHPDIRDLTGMREAQNCRTIALHSAEPQMQVALAAARNGADYALNGMKIKAAH
jgi:UrcA family protein